MHHHRPQLPGPLILLSALALLAPCRALGQQDQPPAAKIRAHEWGVWKLSPGRIAHLEELARESPGFVFRSSQAPASIVPPAPPPRPRPRPVVRPGPLPPFPIQPIQPVMPEPINRISRKPVLFLYTDQPTALEVEVGFQGGEPWLFYPSATVGQTMGVGRSLSWTGRLVPQARAALVPAPSDHWWEELRDVGADLFLSDLGSAERFLFYDGPVAFERPFQISRSGAGASVTPLSTEQTLWLVEGDHFVESQVQRGQRSPVSVSRGDVAGLRQRLDQELRQRGLSHAEATSLLETWRDELFTSQAARAIYFVPRHLYDRMLPLRIHPAPVELVRVGLVIEELE